MPKALLAVTLTASLAVPVAGCEKKKEHTPPKPIITAQEVEICVDVALNTRNPDMDCADNSTAACCDWRYIRNNPAWPLELPAVGQIVDTGRAFLEPLPGSKPERIAPQGAVFTANTASPRVG